MEVTAMSASAALAESSPRPASGASSLPRESSGACAPPRRLPPMTPAASAGGPSRRSRARTRPLPPITERVDSGGGRSHSAQAERCSRSRQIVTGNGDVKIMKEDQAIKTCYEHTRTERGEMASSSARRQTPSTDDARRNLSRRSDRKKCESGIKEAEEQLKSESWKDNIEGIRSVVGILRSYQTDVRNREVLPGVLKQTLRLLASPHRKVTMEACDVAADLLGLPGVILRPDTDKIITKIFVHIAEVKYGIYTCALEAKDKFLYLADTNHSLKALVRVAESARSEPVRAAVASAILQLLETRGAMCWTQTSAEIRELAQWLASDNHESTRRQGELLQAWFRF